MPVKEYDLIIIGAGPAGLTAGLYAARRTLKVLILSKDLGGQASMSNSIENYPGVNPIDGLVLMQRFAKQAQAAGTEIKYGEVLEIKKAKRNFTVFTAKEEFKARAIILAFGLLPRNLKIPGEEKFLNKGVSYCATCDGPLFKNKTLAVVGGGNSALEAAEYLARMATKVYLIHRRNQFRGDEVTVNKLKKNKKVELVMSTQIMEIKGQQFVESIVIKDTDKDEKKNIKVDAVFVEIGFLAKTNFVSGIVGINDKKEIHTDKDCMTSDPAIFACGDVTNANYKQIVVSAGEGAKAALQAYKFLCLDKGQKILPDW